jgi:hypothetical protein
MMLSTQRRTVAASPALSLVAPLVSSRTSWGHCVKADATGSPLDTSPRSESTLVSCACRNVEGATLTPRWQMSWMAV